MTTTTFTPKTTKWGDIVWTSFFTDGATSRGGNTYVMVAKGATQMRFDDSRGIAEVRAVMRGTRIAAWDIVLFGDVIDTVARKVDAQVELIQLFAGDHL